VVKETFTIAADRRRLTLTKETEEIEQGIIEAKAETEVTKILAAKLKLEEQLKFDQSRVEAEIQVMREKLAKRLQLEDSENKLAAEALKRADAADKQRLSTEAAELDQRIKELEAESAATKEKIEAVSPALIEALQAFGDKDLVARVAQSMAPLALLQGNSVADALNTLTRGTTVEHLLSGLLNGKSNGKAELTK